MHVYKASVADINRGHYNLSENLRAASQATL